MVGRLVEAGWCGWVGGWVVGMGGRAIGQRVGSPAGPCTLLCHIFLPPDPHHTHNKRKNTLITHYPLPQAARELFGADRLPTLVQYDPFSRFLERHPEDGAAALLGVSSFPVLVLLFPCFCAV